MLGAGKFTVLVDGALCHFDHWDDIPAVVDNIIAWLPEIPPGPHTHEQHEAIDQLSEVIKRFMERERKCQP